MVKALIRTEDTEQRKLLEVPWEWVLWVRCKRRGSLPVAGGELEQPHLLMACLDIIDTEQMLWDQELAKAKEANNRLASSSNTHVQLPPDLVAKAGRK